MAKKTHQRVIEITTDDIANGIARLSDGCPIAEAIHRTYPNVIHPHVDVVSIRWSDPVKRKRYVFTTPVVARQFIVDFDQGSQKRLKPFAFGLQAPIQIVDMRTRSAAQKVERKQREKAVISTNSRGEVTRVGGRILPIGNVKRHRRFGMRELIE